MGKAGHEEELQGQQEPGVFLGKPKSVSNPSPKIWSARGHVGRAWPLYDGPVESKEEDSWNEILTAA